MPGNEVGRIILDFERTNTMNIWGIVKSYTDMGGWRVAVFNKTACLKIGGFDNTW